MGATCLLTQQHHHLGPSDPIWSLPRTRGLENSAEAAPLSWKHYPHMEENVPFQGSLHLSAPW